MRIYIDTSVVSGRFDHPESLPFWEAVMEGRICLIVSDILLDELVKSPAHVREFFETIPDTLIERVALTSESSLLALQYIAARVVGAASIDDCHHVAVATVCEADVLVSYNMKHIVKATRVRGYNAVNSLFGFKTIDIKKPEDVLQ